MPRQANFLPPTVASATQVLPSLLPSGGGMPGSIIDVPALPQPVDVTATPASSSSSGGGGSSGAGPSSSSGSGGTASNIVPAAKEGGSSSGGGSKEGGGGGGGKGVTVTLASSGGATPQQELAAQAAAATAAAVLQDPATLSKIAAAISPDDIIANPQTGGINVLASYDMADEAQR